MKKLSKQRQSKQKYIEAIYHLEIIPRDFIVTADNTHPIWMINKPAMIDKVHLLVLRYADLVTLFAACRQNNSRRKQIPRSALLSLEIIERGDWISS